MGLGSAQVSAWQQSTLKGFVPALEQINSLLSVVGELGWAGKEKASVKQLKELRTQRAMQAAEEEEAEETQLSPTQLNLLRDRPLPCEEEKETVTKETVTMWC